MMMMFEFVKLRRIYEYRGLECIAYRVVQNLLHIAVYYVVAFSSLATKKIIRFKVVGLGLTETK